ncbi:TPA: hypothetical protein QCY15_000933 [Bacillus paranthracis]|nr:hypothetical protein [Bacillus paranthracis]
MNIYSHHFREGNGRENRIWLDLIFKNELHQVVDCNKIDKEDYLLQWNAAQLKILKLSIYSKMH